MDIAKKRRPAEVLLGFFLLCHPLPVLFHILAVTVFALLALWPLHNWNSIGLIIAAHAALQLSIAVCNDYCDRQADAVSKKDKPIPRGLVRPHEALITALLLIVVMILLLLPLNPLALLISLLYLLLGQSYNFGLKSTPLSGVVFALAIPLIPVYAFVAAGRIIPFILWLVPVAAFLGIALNLANSLPDIEDDAANNARTLAVVLGIKRSSIACSACLLLSIILIAVLTITHLVPAREMFIGPTLFFSLLGVIALLFFFGPEPSAPLRKLYFYLVTLLCLILGSGWLLAAFAG
ncbi:MAG: UbiA family prenyltransferase [Ktedonobacteraceae bacterium]|nr:UbiA family prenyltransferase [Ktedonobacteraceae bacterium]